MADYLPASEDAQKTWLTNYSSKLAIRGPQVGLTASQIAEQQALCAAIIARIDEKAAKKAEWQSAVQAADTGNAADFETLRKGIAAIKTTSSWTEAIAADLGVTGGGSSFDPATYKAELRSVEQTGPSTVTVKFGKAGGAIDGVNVYSRLQGGTNWEFLARDTRSPYIDTTPLKTAGTPEIREYRVRGVLNDLEIGDYSDTMQLTVS